MTEPEIVSRKTFETAGHVAGRANVQDVRLQGLTVELNDFGAHAPLVADLDIETHATRAEGASYFVVSAKYDVMVTQGRIEDDEVVDETGSEDEPAAVIEFQLVALFDLKEPEGQQDARELTDVEFDAFAASTGQMTLHPYARELIQDMTGRLGLPSLTIAPVRIDLSESTS